MTNEITSYWIKTSHWSQRLNIFVFVFWANTCRYFTLNNDFAAVEKLTGKRFDVEHDKMNEKYFFIFSKPASSNIF